LILRSSLIEAFDGFGAQYIKSSSLKGETKETDDIL